METLHHCKLVRGKTVVRSALYLKKFNCTKYFMVPDFCETLISISKLRLSRKTLISFSISTLKFSLRTLILILNSQKFSNSHSHISTLNSRISEKSQPVIVAERSAYKAECCFALYLKRPPLHILI